MKKLIALATMATFLGVCTAWAAPEKAESKGNVVKKVDLKGKADQKIDKNVKVDQKGKVIHKGPRKGGDILRELIKKGKIKPMNKQERALRKQRRLEAERDLDKLLK